MAGSALFFSPIDLDVDEGTVVQPDLVLLPRTDPLPPRWRILFARVLGD